MRRGLFSWTVVSDIASLKKGRQGIKHSTLPLISTPSFLIAESAGSPVVACLLVQSISWRRVTSRMEGKTKYSPACLPLNCGPGRNYSKRPYQGKPDLMTNVKASRRIPGPPKRECREREHRER